MNEMTELTFTETRSQRRQHLNCIAYIRVALAGLPPSWNAACVESSAGVAYGRAVGLEVL